MRVFIWLSIQTYVVIVCQLQIETDMRYVLECLYVKMSFKEGMQVLMKELDRSRASRQKD